MIYFYGYFCYLRKTVLTFTNGIISPYNNHHQEEKTNQLEHVLKNDKLNEFILQ